MLNYIMKRKKKANKSLTIQINNPIVRLKNIFLPQ